jgi:hypothetical protein
MPAVRVGNAAEARQRAYDRLKADQDAGVIKVIRLDDALWLDSAMALPSLP